METYMRFCTHLERNSLNIYQREICFKQKLQLKMKHFMSVFSAGLTIFEVTEQ
jgi:hypothetical protein